MELMGAPFRTFCQKSKPLTRQEASLHPFSQNPLTGSALKLCFTFYL